MGSSNVWTIAAVVVAVIGSAIVAWQAWETHRTTDLGRAALAASHSLAIDGARSRLDQGAPRVDVYVEGVSVLTAGLVDGPGSAIEPGERWNLSQEADRLLQVQARVRVKNLMSDRTTHLKVTGLHDRDLQADNEVLLLPTTEQFYFLTAAFTLSQWAENWESHQAGQPPPHVVAGCVESGDDRDEGVVDEWPLRLAAWPIRPAGDAGGTWQLTAGSDWSDIAMRPLRERSYWISQRRGIPLPDLPDGRDPAPRRVRKGRALCPPTSRGREITSHWLSYCADAARMAVSPAAEQIPQASDPLVARPRPVRLRAALPAASCTPPCAGDDRGRQVAALPWPAGCDETRNAYTTVELRYWLVAKLKAPPHVIRRKAAKRVASRYTVFAGNLDFRYWRTPVTRKTAVIPSASRTLTRFPGRSAPSRKKTAGPCLVST
jgi:hypothetical protein